MTRYSIAYDHKGKYWFAEYFYESRLIAIVEGETEAEVRAEIKVARARCIVKNFREKVVIPREEKLSR